MNALTNSMPSHTIEIVPAILRKTYEKIEEDWNKIRTIANHIQIDITDGIFAGEGTFRDLPRFKQLYESQKIELHLMVHTPSHFVDDVINLSPARCIFHLEAFAGGKDIDFVYRKLREHTQMERSLAINPETPLAYLEEHLPLVNYVLFMGYNPGWANQPMNELVFNKIRTFVAKYPKIPVAVDGHVSKETIPEYVGAGARILCANTAIFGGGDPQENYRQLQLLAASVVKEATH